LPSSSELRPSAAALALDGVSKRFGGVLALSGVRLELWPGQVMALLGENGAGKSTAVKLLTGVYRPDAGVVRVSGEPVRFADTRHAWQHGIAAVYQDAAAFDELSVVENIFMGHFLTSGSLRGPAESSTQRGLSKGRGWLDWATMRRRASASLQSLQADVDVDTPLGALSLAQKHLVAIARALVHEARVLILDEPTASLSSREVGDLHRVVRRLAADGVAVLFISHKLDEVLTLADRYTVFRDGRHVAEGAIAEIDEPGLVHAMVGRAIDRVFPKADASIGRVVLEVRELGNGADFEDVSFDLRAGEVLGFYGLVGAGRTELVEALFGLSPPSHGSATLEGRPVARSPRESIESGLVLVPEDRQNNGVFAALSIRDNLALPSLGRLARGPFVDELSEQSLAREIAERLAIKHQKLDQPVSELSGGNQQKVVIGKWLATDPKVVILDEPTQGVDVGAKAAVHELLGELVGRGLAVILVSSELPEVLGVSDRIAVMRAGRLVCFVPRAEFDARAIVSAALGVESEEGAYAKAVRSA
jgi:rhamnose transport system ATP-binding protein